MGSWNSKQRWIGLAAAAFSFGLAALVGAGSCATLPTIDRNVCGNNVHEETEDCDGFPVLFDSKPEDAGPDFPMTACGAPSDPGACRYVCKYRGDYPVCPEKSGYGCGVDNICRVSTGLSTTPLSVAGGGALRLFSADFDNDGREDAVAVSETAIDIHWFATSGSVDRTVTVPSDGRKLPGIGDLNGDARADLVLNLGTGLGVLLGQEDRTLVTRSYPSRVLEPTMRRVVPLGLGTLEAELLVFGRANEIDSFELSRIFPARLTGSGLEPIELDNPTPLKGALSGAVGVGRVSFIGTRPCPRVAFMLDDAGQSTLYVLDWKEVLGKLKGTIEAMPLGPVSGWGGAFFADVEGDGDEDLLYGASSKVYVRRNDGATLGAPELLASQQSTMCQSDTGLLGPPLAVGDLNGDNLADLVDEAGIWFQGGAFPRKCIGDGWKAALIADFDGNGRVDVLAARNGKPLLDFWGGVGGGAFNTVTVTLGFEVAEMVSGDFDGDSIADAVLRPSNGDGGADAGAPRGSRDIFVLFGKPFSAPDAPARLGELVGDATAIIAGQLSGHNAAGDVDPLTDLVILSSPPEPGGEIPLALIPGHPRRRLLAPLSLTSTLALDVSSKATPKQILISNFLASSCGSRTGDEATITAIDSSENIWIAGCEMNGLGKIVLTDPTAEMGDPNGFQFLAPLYEDAKTDTLVSLKSGKDGSNDVTIVRHVVPKEGGVAALEEPSTGDIPNLSLPPIGMHEPFDIPFRWTDADGDGRRDIALTSESSNDSIVVFWNRIAGGHAVDKLDDSTVSVIRVDAATEGTPRAPSGDKDKRRILDFVFINTDGDEAKELFVLTRTGLYFAEATQNENGPPTYALDPTPFYATPAAKALLAIDANSDGIEDLLLADDQKLQLFLGKEGVR